jgi:hypothetical protein
MFVFQITDVEEIKQHLKEGQTRLELGKTFVRYLAFHQMKI